MPVDFAGFDASVKASEKLRKACEALGLDEAKCKKLEGYIGEVCGELGAGARRGRAGRELSAWQLCIRKERAGKPFDPAAMKELAAKYRRGECP